MILSILIFVASNVICALAIFNTLLYFGYPSKIAKINTFLYPLYYILLVSSFRIFRLEDFAAIGILLMAISINIAMLLRVIKRKFQLPDLKIPLLIIVIITINYSKDAFNHISTGYVDSHNSFEWFKSLNVSYESGYQPGYFLFVKQLYLLYDFQSSLNYLGSIIGIIVIINTIFLIYTINKNAGLIFASIIQLPIFLELNKVIIGLTSNSLSFLILAGTIIGLILYYDQASSIQHRNITVAISSLSSAITVPTLTFYLFPLFIIVAIIFRGKEKIRTSLLPTLYLTLGVVIYVVNGVYGTLQSNLQKSTESRSPLLGNTQTVVEIVSKAPRELDQSEVLSLSDQIIALLRDYLVFSSEVRPLSGWFSISGYLILICILLVLFSPMGKRRLDLKLLLVFLLYFGIITMLGVFDLTYIKGRAGWYYLFIFAITISFLFSYIKVISARSELIPLLFILVSIITYFYWPIYHYRYVDENVYRAVRDLTFDLKNSNQIFINDTLPYAKNISNKIYLSSDEALMSDPSKGKTIIFVLDFNTKLLDPTLSRQFQKSEINNSNFLEKLYQIRDDKIRDAITLQKYLLDEDYDLYKSVDGYKIFWKSKIY